jgi:hypothetical protein
MLLLEAGRVKMLLPPEAGLAVFRIVVVGWVEETVSRHSHSAGEQAGRQAGKRPQRLLAQQLTMRIGHEGLTQQEV